MATVTFSEVAIRGSKRVKCARGCGSTLMRSRKFWQTLSPFNKNAAGELKTRDEIQEQLFAERRAWMNEPETCKRCQEATQ
jgi:hypothetical protein